MISAKRHADNFFNVAFLTRVFFGGQTGVLVVMMAIGCLQH